jgi:aubergine-like protein
MRLYLVTFDPVEDNIRKRRALIRQQEAIIGPCLFEGTQLFTTKELPEAALNMVVFFPDKPEQQWHVKIQFIRVCDPLEPVVTQLYNVLIKKAQQILELSLLGRFYFDHMAKISIQAHRLQLWPGFITSMRQMENEILLNVDLTFKVCRTDDVLSFMKEVRTHNPQNYREACETALVGTVVMTIYNRQTYKIDAIDWDLKPSNTFEQTKKGETRTVTFIDYYRSKGYEVQNQNQPMIISKATKSDIRRGDIGDRILIPEMCYQTGLSDDMRADFRLMKDISMHLHMAPSDRIHKTVEFMRKMVEKAEVIKIYSLNSLLKSTK